MTERCKIKKKLKSFAGLLKFDLDTSAYISIISWTDNRQQTSNFLLYFQSPMGSTCVKKVAALLEENIFRDCRNMSSRHITDDGAYNNFIYLICKDYQEMSFHFAALWQI